MGEILISSDLHFGHDKNFIYEPRGFQTIEEHDAETIRRFNRAVGPHDDLYLLGDLVLGDLEHGRSCLEQLHGNLHIVLGNHDTINRINMYQELSNVAEIIGYAGMLKYNKWRFYLSHYPTITDNFDDDKKPWQQVKCLFGHTHQTYNFYNDNPLMYHVGVDSHDCRPVFMDIIVDDIKQEIAKRKEQNERSGIL